MVHVAIVEDNDIQRELCVAVLEAAGYEVTAFATGEDFLKVKTQQFAVVVIDLNLGKGMHGVTLIRMLGRFVKCIAVTGSDPTLRGQALLTGALLTLPKPIPIRALALAIELALVL